jgi:toxin ParE1/3/4
MASFVLSPLALKDVEDILVWTIEHFGEQASQRYELLLGEAIQQVADQFDRPGSHQLLDVGPNVYSYHLRHSCNRVRDKSQRVKEPRHFLIYRVNIDGIVEIARVLHDSMDIVRHIR